MSACEKVFQVTELAEAIFLELSISILLCRVQRTCRGWRAIVASSARLQQALFFTPIARVPLKLGERPTHLYESYESEEDEPNTHLQTVVEHPLLTKIGSSGTSLALLFKPKVDAVLRPEASWRRCLVTQPPVTEICTYTNDETVGYRRIEDVKGVRLGDLMPDERAIRSLHASHIYAWVTWRKFSLCFGYFELNGQIQDEARTELRRLGLG